MSSPQNDNETLSFVFNGGRDRTCQIHIVQGRERESYRPGLPVFKLEFFYFFLIFLGFVPVFKLAQ